MLVTLAEIPPGNTRRQVETAFSSEQALDAQTVEPVSCEVVFDRHGDHVAISVDWSAKVRHECSRCCGTFEAVETGSFDAVLVRQGDIADDGEADYIVSSDVEQIDLAGALYEDVVTSLPLMPLCRSDCPGVEAPQPSDPRWAALRQARGGRL